uniref:Uncharacterized protein n=1 Tax=Arundo donax TaxID=35708 RepID=A0A0A9EYU9_ARUDO
MCKNKASRPIYKTMPRAFTTINRHTLYTRLKRNISCPWFRPKCILKRFVSPGWSHNIRRYTSNEV